MQSIETIIEPYIQLEQNVRELMSGLFTDVCGLCTACCCRADICEEALESAFLSNLLKRQSLDANDMDERYGWLDQQGCSLEYGRPPVCYAYFCDQLLARLPDDDARWVTRILGRLVEYVGENALKEWHLVELRTRDDIQQVDIEKLAVRLAQSEEAFQAIEHFFASGHLDRADRALLESIGIPDE